jgi:hypothetical protein
MLSKQLRALETICRKLDGQRFSLRDEVVSYLRRYSLVSEARARKLVEVIKVPLLEAYIFTYFYGKRLMEPHLRGPDRCAVFERFLSEPLTPSDVA